MYQGTHSECIARIEPSTGNVIGWIDMRGLLAKQRSMVRAQPHNYVLNGVAYHKRSNRLYVTGKQWDKMYQVCAHPQLRTPLPVAAPIARSPSPATRPPSPQSVRRCASSHSPIWARRT